MRYIVDSVGNLKGDRFNPVILDTEKEKPYVVSIFDIKDGVTVENLIIDGNKIAYRNNAYHGVIDFGLICIPSQSGNDLYYMNLMISTVYLRSDSNVLIWIDGYVFKLYTRTFKGINKITGCGIEFELSENKYASIFYDKHIFSNDINIPNGKYLYLKYCRLDSTDEDTFRYDMEMTKEEFKRSQLFN